MTGGDSTQTPLALAASVPAAKPKTIRDHILEELELAFPASMKAKRLRGKLEQLGFSVHSKTVGMSLYRLSNEGLVRREGKGDWFFVPESERILREAKD